MTLKAMDVVGLVAFPIVFCLYFSRWNSFHEKIMWLLYWTMFLLCFFYLLNKRLYFRKIRSFLLVDCDPVRMLSCIMALIAHSNRRKGRNWGLHFYNICTCLYYAGRFEDVRRILPLFPKCCPAEADRLKYELLCARLAYHEKDEKALYMHCNYLNSWAGRLKKRNLFCGIYQETMQFPMLLRMEKDGAWQQVYGMLRQAEAAVGHSGRRSMLSRVKANYLLYRMAKGMGDEQCTAYHRAECPKTSTLIG